MPRPGQQASRRKRPRTSTTPSSKGQQVPSSKTNDESGSPNPRARCLPVADLPDDFLGEPEDGAQYLAMALKHNDALPWSTRMEGWISQGEQEERMEVEKDVSTTKSPMERHVALPKGTWEVLFPLHLQNYRKNLAERWPPSPPIPYPSDYPAIPDASRRSDWYMFINGYTLSEKSDSDESKGKAKAVEMTEEEAMNEAMNGVVENKAEEEHEELPKKGRYREPLVSVLQCLNSNQAVRILSHFAHWLTEAITQLPPPYPTSPDLLPTQPDFESPASPSPRIPARPPNPFPPHYAQWILALLMIVDGHLSGGQTSTLRDLARAAMRVAGWRWVRGVVSKDVTEGWKLGAKGWNLVSTASLVELEEGEEESVDEMLARSWVVVHAIAAGWGQRDLLDDLENLFK